MMEKKSITAAAVTKALRALGNPDIAAHSQGFFKTGKGEYGEGDIFIGVRVPVVRAQVKKYKGIGFDETLKLLSSTYHEIRLCAALMLVDQFARGDEPAQKRIYQTYVKSAKHINNWDLVDCSAHKIVGPWLSTRSRNPLYKLAKSKNLWERRIAIMSTFHFIRAHDFENTLNIADRLLDDKHDLIHKAVGWMLREVGKRDKKVATDFLRDQYPKMPRTMLRYAIEKFPQTERK